MKYIEYQNEYQTECERESSKMTAYLETVSYWHNLTPKLWVSDYSVKTEDVLETKQRILSTEPACLCLILAVDEEEAIKGFIWAQRESDKADSVMILSLYVEESVRKMGVGRTLKLALESWCLRHDVYKINTTVHYTNKNMLKVNFKMGYRAGMVSMTKQLKA